MNLRRLIVVSLMIASACNNGDVAGVVAGEPHPYRWELELPPGFPVPRVPSDNPMTYEKVELGRHLFYDPHLSANGMMACANCHVQERGFAEGRPVSIGSTGEHHPRNSMALANAAYQPVLTWANPNMTALERQALVPMFGEHPVELGLSGMEEELLRRLGADARYRELFLAGFPRESPAITLNNVVKAIASFERSLVSGRSAYDRYLAGDAAAITQSAKRGAEVFFSERGDCSHCHGGLLFTGTMDDAGRAFAEREYLNNGLYNIDGSGAYPSNNVGLMEFSGRAEDMGKFKAPSLRNVEVTAPYMHDGSIATLEEVVEHYDAGGRRILSGAFAGDGSRSPLKSTHVRPLGLSAQEKSDLVAFLRSLTDSAFLRDRRFANPWTPSR